jgi:hypothetical protein
LNVRVSFLTTRARLEDAQLDLEQFFSAGVTGVGVRTLPGYRETPLSTPSWDAFPEGSEGVWFSNGSGVGLEVSWCTDGEAHLVLSRSSRACLSTPAPDEVVLNPLTTQALLPLVGARPREVSLGFWSNAARCWLDALVVRTEGAFVAVLPLETDQSRSLVLAGQATLLVGGGDLREPLALAGYRRLTWVGSDPLS